MNVVTVKKVFDSMYYLIAFLIYSLIVLLFVLYVMTPSQMEKRQFKGVLVDEMMKSLTKSDVRSRKKRVKILPLYQRFLYWLWFSSIIAMIVVPAIVLSVARYYLIDYFFVPENAFCIDLNTPALLVFGFGAFLTGIPVLVAYSYLTNRGIIRKADLLYQLGSFQEYPKRMNILISGVLMLIGLPLMMLGFNSYRYFSDEQITVKSALSSRETVYSYYDVSYIEHSFYRDDTSGYSVILKNGTELSLNEDISRNQEFINTINNNHIEIKDRYVKPAW